jgi:hypothetical protein
MKATNWRAVGKGSLIGTFSLEMPSGLILHECALFEKGDRRWVAGPSRKIGTGDAAKYVKLMEFTSRDTSDAFNTDALDALDASGVSR